MYNKIESGYDLFIRITEDCDWIGTLTLKGEGADYKDIDPVEPGDMDFIKEYSFIYDMLRDGYALFVSYHKEEDEFFVSIREKVITGEYQDIVNWNHIIVSQKKKLSDAFRRLNEKIQDKIEGSVLN